MTFGKNFWMDCIQKLSYVSARELPRLHEMTEDQLRLIEELLHRQAVRLRART